MIHRIRFYFTYALRNIRRGGRWTTLAILCITAGVATVVALRSLGLAVGDTLTNNVRVEVKGDLLIRNDSIFGGFGSNDPRAFTPEELQTLLAWAEAKGAADIGLHERAQYANYQSRRGAIWPPQLSSAATSSIRRLIRRRIPSAPSSPRARPLAELFTGGNDVVISDNLAQQGGISVGDSVRVSGTQAPYTVRGIVSVAEESSVTNFLNAFFGFAYFDLANAQAAINEEFAPNRIGLLFASRRTKQELDELAAEVEALARASARPTSMISSNATRSSRSISATLWS